MSSRIAALMIALAAVLASAPRTSAHEFWLKPSEARPRTGETIAVRFFVGERFAGEEVGFASERVLSFDHVREGSVEPLAGEEGVGPAAVLGSLAPGVHLVAYASTSSGSVLPAGRFNDYLLDDGLYEPLAARRHAGLLDAPGRERYARCAKTIVVAGAPADWASGAGADVAPAGQGAPGADADGAPAADAAAPFWSRPVGHRLEIVPLTDPARLAALGGEIDVRVLYEGAPLAGAVILSASQESPQSLTRALTDLDGRARFALDRPGLWMISLVHMAACTDDATADWLCTWATLVLVAGTAAPQADAAIQTVSSSRSTP